jgi:SAM-dependent methyltransferase
MHPQDHFSKISSQYAASRPRYPRALYEWLAQIAPGRERAWDCACGNGQAASDLAGHFSQVIATDLSAEQLREATPHPRIEYPAAVAEASGLPVGSVDVVTVAQALHWFELNRFYQEVRRVLRPGGVLAAWCYGAGSIAVGHADACTRDSRVLPLQRRHGDRERLARFAHEGRSVMGRSADLPAVGARHVVHRPMLVRDVGEVAEIVARLRRDLLFGER